MIFDAHFHYAVCYDNFPEKASLPVSGWCGLSCAHSFSEWERQKLAPSNVYPAFGIHPQLVGKLSDDELKEYMSFLENLASTGQICAIGEAGFDLFTEDFKRSKEKQEVVWQFQIELAQKYKLPVVVHCRKANDMLFKYAKELKKLPAVLFHSFMGSLVEAESLIKRNINCFFSFGKQMMNNNKKVIDCVKNLPLKNLLLETDAPFQTLKGQDFTYPGEVADVYKESLKLRRENLGESERGGRGSDEDRQVISMSFDEYCDFIFNNAKNLVSAIQI